jgi:hypothetical protein
MKSEAAIFENPKAGGVSYPDRVERGLRTRSSNAHLLSGDASCLTRAHPENLSGGQVPPVGSIPAPRSSSLLSFFVLSPSGFRILSSVLCLLFSVVGAAPTNAATATEYDLKAAFLFNFVLFTTWPESALPPAGEPFVIGIVGTDPFGQALDRVVSGEAVSGRPIVVRRFATAAEAGDSRMVYISRSEETRLPAVLGEFRGKPVLTVSDIERFAYAGGVIGLAVEQGKIRVQVNVDRAKASGLTIGAKLLRIARVISDESQSMTPDERFWHVFAD